MKPAILALALSFAAASLVAPMVAHAQGEGNGPSFPGLQDPNFGVTTPVGPVGRSSVTETVNHSASDYVTGVNAAVPQAPAGLSRTRLARRAHTWQMLNDNTHG